MKTFGLLPLIGLAIATTLTAANERPNILYFYADDMGWGSIGPNGQALRAANGDAYVLTPNLDALAAAGVNFRRAYGCTVCSPARSSQQLGMHQGHTYADRNNTDNARKAMRADDVSMGKILSAAGYATGYWGKWGYGASEEQNNPVILNIQTLPTSHGYDDILAELHHVRAHTFFQPTLWHSAPGSDGLALIPNSMSAYTGVNYPQTPAFQSDPAYPATAYCDDFYAMRALEFVRTRAQDYNENGTPFFGLFACQIPHAPFDDVIQLPRWDSAYADKPYFAGLSISAKQWCAMVTRIDAHFGNILHALEDPDNDGDTSDSVAEDTLVIFMSDNGGWQSASVPELDSNGGLRGAKGSIWEGGIRVPCVMRWPAKFTAGSILRAGSDTDRLLDVSDLLPTFAELAGADRPLGLDGVSLAPSFTGNGEQRRRDFLIHEAGASSSIIRGDYKLVKNGGLELYNLVDDPGESNDISNSNAALVDELAAILTGEMVDEPAWFANTYHRWTGNDAPTSDAANWSDYEYRNDVNNLVYMTDSGGPRESWTARMENTGISPNLATADADLSVLALEIRGSSADAKQTFDLGEKTLTGRNEVRLADHSELHLNNGTISSLRWLDLAETAEIKGAGRIDTTCYNAGRLTVTKSSDAIVTGPPVEVPGPEVTLADGMELLRNNGFESGTDTGGGDYSYESLAYWTTDGNDISVDGAKPNNARSGTMRGLIFGGSPDRNLLQESPYPFVSGDSYTLSFWHQGFSSWTTGELAKVQIYYLDSSGGKVVVYEDTFGLTNGTWIQATHEIPAIADAAASGKAIRILLGAAGGTGFASFDDVSLVRHGSAATVPGPSVLTPGEDIVVPGSRRMVITGDLSCSDSSAISLAVAGKDAPGGDFAQILVSGAARLAGTLAIDLLFAPGDGDSFTLLEAASLSGTFATNPVLAADGTRFDLTYSATSVTATVHKETSRGTSFRWLEQNGLVSPGSALAAYETADLSDDDGDGLDASGEFIAGTDPNDAGSSFRATVNGGLELTWPSVEGRVYTVLSSRDLADAFTIYSGPHAASPPENRVSLLPLDPAGSLFFRIVAEIE